MLSQPSKGEPPEEPPDQGGHLDHATRGRWRTMEAADILYGVTMQPGGSSKVVSEKVTEYTGG